MMFRDAQRCAHLLCEGAYSKVAQNYKILIKHEGCSEMFRSV